MASRDIYESVQITSAAGTPQKIYEPKEGEVLIVQKCLLVNTDTTANGYVNLWIDGNGGSSVAFGDLSHVIVDKVVQARETVVVSIPGLKVPDGGQMYADAKAALAGGNFQNKINVILGGVTVTQSATSFGTSQ